MGMHSTFNLEDGYLGSGTRLAHSIRKYGRENFKIEILEFLEDRVKLKIREKELVNEMMIQDPMCMNLKPGGEGGICNEDHKKKFRDGGNKAYISKYKNDIEFQNRMKLILLNNNKKIHTNGNKRYDTFLGKTHTEETKQKMRLSKLNHGTGDTNSQYGLKWVHNLEKKLNKKVSKEDVISYLDTGWLLGRKMKW